MMADEANPGIDAAANAAKSAADRTANAANGASDALRDAGQKARDTFQERVADPAKRAGDAIKATGEKIQHSGSTIGMKMIDQAESNAHAAFSAMRDAAKAKDVSEVMKIQGDFLREQGSRSMSQAREISELIMQFGRDAVGSLRGGA